jgi:hypothetical protein
LKYLVVIALVVLLLVLLFRKLRPYLQILRNFINAIRQFQNAGAFSSKRSGGSEKLVRCETCGVWIPATRALSSRSGELLFCSTDCLRGKKKRD